MKMSTDARHSLNGPTMGTRWTALFVAGAAFDSAALAADLAAAVACVDEQMSTWKPSSDLMRLNRAALEEWQAMPPQIMVVLAAAAGVEKTGQFRASTVDARGFDQQVDVEGPPVDRFRGPRMADRDAPAVDAQGAVAGFHRAAQAAVRRVVARQVGHAFQVGRFVDGNHLQVVRYRRLQ